MINKNLFFAKKGFFGENDRDFIIANSVSHMNEIRCTSPEASYAGGFVGYSHYSVLNFTESSSTNNNIYGKVVGYFWGYLDHIRNNTLLGNYQLHNFCNSKLCGMGKLTYSNNFSTTIITYTVSIGT